MIHEIILPMFGETMDAGQITAWLKAEGDKVTKGEPLFEVTTDKAAFEAEASADGYLRKILVQASEDQIPVAKVIAYIADSMDEALPEARVAKAAPAPAAATASPSPAAQAPVQASAADSKRIKISPVARKLAKQHGVDLQQLSGRGPGGRITKEDVLAMIEGGIAAPAAKPAKQAVAAAPTKPVVMSRMRKIIARRLLESKQTIPHYYLTAKVRVDDFIKLRGDLIDEVKKVSDARLTYTDLVVKAVGLALRDCPMVNATFDGEQIHLATKANVGLAVAVPDGLVVPVIRDVCSKSLGQITAERAALVAKARASKLSMQEMSGGSFTVTNLGVQPIEQFAAIINPPEVGILAVGQISKAALVDENDHLMVGSVMHITLSADHRVVDGAVGAEFMTRLINLLEGPYQLLGQGI